MARHFADCACEPVKSGFFGFIGCKASSRIGGIASYRQSEPREYYRNNTTALVTPSGRPRLPCLVSRHSRRGRVIRFPFRSGLRKWPRRTMEGVLSALRIIPRFAAHIAEVRISMGCLSNHRLNTLNAIIASSIGN